MLTGLHGIHVARGLVALTVIRVFAARGRYCWAHYPGVCNAAIYWNEQPVVWAVLFGLLPASW